MRTRAHPYGTNPSSCGQNDLQYGQLEGHAATVALFAYPAAFPRSDGGLIWHASHR